MKPRDTSSEAYRVQIAACRSMTPTQRLQAASELSELMLTFLKAGIHHRHPDYTQQEVRLAAIRHLLGAELFALAYPDALELDP